MALVFAMLLGADSIDDCDVLRAGRTRRLLGGWLPAPSTLGTFLRAFTFGHVRQLDRVLGDSLTRAWRAGAGPGAERLIVDVDSFIGQAYGYKKEGVGFGYTKQRGYHPLLASRAATGEVLHVRLRKGQANTQRGVVRFAEELIARVTRAGASGEKLLRADSGFWNRKLIARLESAGWRYSISVRLQFWVPDAIKQIPEQAWQPLEDYPKDGEAQIAETATHGRRLIVRRTRLIGAASRAVARLAVFPVHHQPHRPLGGRGGRAPPARRRRAHDPRPEGPSPSALPLRPVQREQRLDSDRRHRAQPAALDQRDRALRRDRPRCAHHPPPAAADPRPADAHRAPMDTSPSCPLALAGRLHPCAHTHTSTTHSGLTHSPPATATTQTRRRHRRSDHAKNTPADTPQRTSTAITPPTRPAQAPNNPTNTTNPAPPRHYTVAVGTGVAARPPRRSQRAGLPHWAPALGDGGESLLGPGMQDSR